MITKRDLKRYRKHRKSEPLLQRWGPKTIGVGTQQRNYSTTYSVCKCGISIYRKKLHWKGGLYDYKAYYNSGSSYGSGIFNACRFMVYRIFENPPGVGVAF